MENENVKIDEPEINKQNSGMNLENKLYAEGDKLWLKLAPLANTAVNPGTQEKYDGLMQVYEAGKWGWNGEDSPTSRNYWIQDKEEFCVDAGVSHNLKKEGKFGFRNKSFYIENNYKIISDEEFYKAQSISQETLRELNEWFEKNKPARESRERKKK